MDLSIIILNYYNKNLVKELLNNIKKLNLNYDYEILVVDNASYDGIEELVKYNNKVKFIQSKNNKGFAAGNNLGINESKGKYILICNPDLAILSNGIDILYEYMEKNKEVALAGPRLINANKTIQYSCTRFPDWHLPFYRRTILGKTKKGKKWLNNYLMKDLNHHNNYLVPALFGACMIIRKSSLYKVGFLDERYFMYMEDLDLSRRFWENNYKVSYVGQAEIIHLHRRESAQENIVKSLFSKSAKHHIISFIKYLIKFRNKKLPKIK